MQLLELPSVGSLRFTQKHVVRQADGAQEIKHLSGYSKPVWQLMAGQVRPPTECIHPIISDALKIRLEEIFQKKVPISCYDSPKSCCTRVVYCGAPPNGFTVSQEKSGASSTRTSVTIPKETYASLEAIAKRKKVSVAWVIRDAAEKYVVEQCPLFAGRKNEG